MEYIYLDNVRGFSHTLIPIKKINFLVGENSTGKSSVLEILHLISKIEYILEPSYAFQSISAINLFSDIVSANSRNRSYFRIGTIKQNGEKLSIDNISVTIRTFEDRDNRPEICSEIRLRRGEVSQIVVREKKIKFGSIPLTLNVGETSILDIVERCIQNSALAGSVASLKDFEQQGLPFGMVRMVLDKNSNPKDPPGQSELMIAATAKAFAPIRSKPERIYEGDRKPAYSREGNHIPALLRRQAAEGNAEEFEKFKDQLRSFGKESGLFSDVIAHSFGAERHAPFEILVKLSKSKLNLSNVGYGVSQVLPIVVELLNARGQETGFPLVYFLQQPEVHLHPRAQAALGELLFHSSRIGGTRFYIETHSDYLIDRFRVCQSNQGGESDSQVLFFSRKGNGNRCSPVDILAGGAYSANPPDEFRSFFLDEALKVIGV